jgi:hypothetical protein
LGWIIIVTHGRTGFPATADVTTGTPSGEQKMRGNSQLLPSIK